MNIQNSQQLCEAILKKTGVLLLSGEHFGHDPLDFTARLAYVDFDGEYAISGIQNRLSPDQFIKTYTPSIYHGIQSLCQFFKSL